MPKVLFLGCNHDQIPYLQAAQKLGFTVIGTDLNPRAPGAALADRFYRVGYTDTEGLLAAAKNEGFQEKDCVFTAAAHFAYEGASQVADALKIPFISRNTVDICLDKTRYYASFAEHGIPVPPTCLFDPAGDGPAGEGASDPARPCVPDPGKVYFLKSDYGKSPSYCYRIKNGQIPSLPQRFDLFYRRHFLLQEEVEGTHFRVNLYAGQAAVFLKLTDAAALPVRTLGPGHAGVIRKLHGLISSLGLLNVLTKFDLIVNETGWYVIDIGLDPPLRLHLLYEHLGLDLPLAYTRFYLQSDPSGFLPWPRLCRPLIIQGTPARGFTFTSI
ncbi:MAG: hypothetical protein AB1847_03685 [bacterium]